MADGDSGAKGDGSAELTRRSSISLTYLPVGAELSPYITTCYHFRCDELEVHDVQPAAVGQLTVFPYGKGFMRFRDGRSEPSHRVNVLTPFSVAAPFHMRGPFHALGAVLSPLGWASLTGLCAARHGNRLMDACDLWGDAARDLGDVVCDRYTAAGADPQELTRLIGAFIAERLRPIAPEHAQLIQATNAWLSTSLNPPVAALYDALPYSRRQVQRLVERFFGLPPRALVRKYRALRAAAWLSLPQLSEEAEAQLSEAFYDQSHLIREIHLFVGRTPARLGDAATPYLTELLDLRNFREISAI
ncbi:AraC family transcriptional regulator [Erythrobacteraceae bacterium CFH 75059]|uniref:AraC family transcriptional regulator n=1 Tax=Qipengyuania thermophila TaxID=2509361 RepID=UPI00102107B1|nr:helix-turn-helix domain-containing protein [Qipengyuania thermophila]TCD06622.1 AraC family transcriptional regulator [Erythrobacteraceae bacterium CFH 75059]